jgi:acyl carrier protein
MEDSRNQIKSRFELSPEKSAFISRQALGELVAGLVARELSVSVAALDRRVPFMELGVNSMMTQTIRNSLEQALGCSIPVVALFNHNTVDQMSTYLSALAAPTRDDGLNRPAPDAKDAYNVVAREMQLDDHCEDELWELLKNELGVGDNEY